MFVGYYKEILFYKYWSFCEMCNFFFERIVLGCFDNFNLCKFFCMSLVNLMRIISDENLMGF